MEDHGEDITRPNSAPAVSRPETDHTSASAGDSLSATNSPQPFVEGSHQPFIGKFVFTTERHVKETGFEQGQKVSQKYAKSKLVYRKESTERKSRGPMVAKHAVNTSSPSGVMKNMNTRHKKSLRPTSPTYESAFTRQIVNRPTSPGIPKRPRSGLGFAVSPSTSFNRGRKTPSNHTSNTDVNMDILKKKLEKASKAKLYLLQSAGPNSFMVGGETADHRHRVVIGPQTCTCKVPFCIHLLFVMARVFQLKESDNLMFSKPLKNYEVETLFNKHNQSIEQRIKQRVTRRHSKQSALSHDAAGSSITAAAEASTSSTAEPIDRHGEEKCPICLLDLDTEENLVSCEHCSNKLHHDCMAVWYQLSCKQGESLNCPLCRQAWNTTNAFSFAQFNTSQSTDGDNASSSHSSSPVDGAPAAGSVPFNDPAPADDVLPIPEEHAERAAPWVQLFGDELIRCVFARQWQLREAALRQLSREVLMRLSHPSDSLDEMLQYCCDIFALMITDPVYKVYVASLRALRTMLSYCAHPNVEALRRSLRPVIRSIVLKSAELNRKTNQLSLSTLCEFSKGQEGELAIGKELNLDDQEGLGGVLYILECCVEHFSMDTVKWPWLNGRLQTMDKLLEEFPAEFTFPPAQHAQLTAVVEKCLIPIVEFTIRALVKVGCSGHQQKTIKLCKRVLVQCARYALILPGMLHRFRELILPIEKDLRARLERRLIDLTVALGTDNRVPSTCVVGGSPDIHNSRVDSPPLRHSGSKSVKRQLSFGLLYSSTPPEEHEEVCQSPISDLASTVLTDRSDSVQSFDAEASHQLKRTESYTEAVYLLEDDTLSCESSSDDGEVFNDEQKKTCTLSRSKRVTGEKPAVMVTKPAVDDMSPDDPLVDEIDGLVLSDVTLTLINQEDCEEALDECDSVPSVVLTKATPDQDTLEFDECDGMVPNTLHASSPPPLHRDTSTGFDVLPDSDSELSDNISGSMTLSQVSTSTDADESDGDMNNLNDLDAPFKQYHPRKHKRSRTDPSRAWRSRTPTKSPRYHSDPAPASNSSPSRSPPMSSSSPRVEIESPILVPHSTPKNIDSKVAEVVVRSASLKRSPRPVTSMRSGRPLSGGSAVDMEETVSTGQHASFSPQGTFQRKSPPPQKPSTQTASTVIVVHPQDGSSCAGNNSTAVSKVMAHKSNTSSVSRMLASSTSGSSDDHKTSDSLCTDDINDNSLTSPYVENVSFRSEVRLFSPRESPDNASNDCHCKDEVELEEAIALAKAMDISMEQPALPMIPGLSNTAHEETITIHIQPGDRDVQDGNANRVEYLENVHWKRGAMIGTGAFSTCYQARDVKTGIIMAVKQISFCRNSLSEQETICQSVREEILMMAQLNHPNVVRILGATQTGYHFNMFVEWMPGGSVSHLLETYGAFSEPVITSYIQQVLMGLAYLHDNAILHRDMKGANLLVDSTGKHLRIGDFGACARLASQMTGAGEFKGQLLGTIAFMAPEVLRGEHYGRACDVWSVGCVIIEMFTEKPPWNASNVSNHLKLIFMIASANSSPPIPPAMPQALKDLMLRCLEADSKDRPSAKDLLQHPLFTRYGKFRR